MAVLYISLYSSKRFEDSFEDKLVEGLQRNKKENTKNSLLYIPKIKVYRVALALALIIWVVCVFHSFPEVTIARIKATL